MSNAAAIVGIGCRFPGDIDDLDSFWSVLAAGRDVVGEVPAQRFDASRFAVSEAGPIRTGGFLGDVTGFDAEYFGITAREAGRIDPQQRLMLELAVEAVENAGYDPAALAGSNTGVFVGFSLLDYHTMQLRDPDSITAHTAGGFFGAGVANRVSYVLNLRGPSIALDTACSSSLTALHLAARAVSSGECDMALAGGVNLILNPFNALSLERASVLSPTGRCHTFSAAADGFVRAEGGGMVLVRRHADAKKDGAQVHAVVLGSAINCDGRTPGLSQPSGAAQEALLREAYSQAEVSADELVYFEAHGTGTPVGDVIECEAIGNALGAHRSPDDPLPIGSVKTNFGHCEAASGMASLVKAVLVLERGSIPVTLHANPLNTAIDFESWNLRPAVTARRWSAESRAAVGVNGFGMGGANGHVILGLPTERPAAAGHPEPADRPRPYVVTGRTPEAARAAARRHARKLVDVADDEFYDYCHTACLRRPHHRHRIAVLADGPERAARRLWSAAREEPVPEAAAAEATERGRMAFVFDGNGSQWAGMGADLLRADPAFAAAVDDIDQVLGPMLGWSVRAELATADTARMALTEVAQPTLFAVQIGLAQVLAAYGIRPHAVVGHSVGEVAAAHVAGVLTLADAATVVAARSRLQAGTAGLGRMAAVGLSREHAMAAIADYGGKLEIAAVNTETDVTIAGPAASLRELGAHLTATDVGFRELDLNYPFHTAAMDNLRQPMLAELSRMAPRPARIPLYSTVTGGRLEGEEADAQYWWHNLRRPVLFDSAVRGALAEDCDLLVEVGPHPVLRGYLRRLTNAHADPVSLVETLSRNAEGPSRLHGCVAAVVAGGGAVDWTAAFPRPGAAVDLPPYPWQRERHWNGDPDRWTRDGAGAGVNEHPLLGRNGDAPNPTWQTRLDPQRLPWIGDHVIAGSTLMPGAAFLDMALTAGSTALADSAELVTAHIETGLPIPDATAAIDLHTSVAPEDRTVRISSRTDTGAWRRHLRATIRRRLDPPPKDLDPESLQDRSPETITATDHYARLATLGYAYGPSLRLLRQLQVAGDEVLGDYECTDRSGRYLAHPAILDAALQACFVTTANTYLPVGVERVRLWRTLPQRGHIHVGIRPETGRDLVADIAITDVSGAVALQLSGCRMRPLDTAPVVAPWQTTVLRAAPRPDEPCAATSFPPLPDLVTTGARLLADPDVLEGHRRYVRNLVALGAHGMAAAIPRLLPETERFGIDDLLAAGVPAKHTRLLRVLLTMAVEHGLLGRTGPRWVRTAEPDPLGTLHTALADAPRCQVEFSLAARAGDRLPELLRDERDIVDFLFGDSTATAVTHMYDLAHSFDHGLRALAETVRHAIADWPADRPLRILEVGAGTGGLSAHLLPLLPRDNTSYVYTDISEAFFAVAGTRFADYDFLTFRRFDLEHDPGEQGFADGTFDIVVASQALHATSDLRSTVGKLTGLLADGGLLATFEIHDVRLTALPFGPLDGLWLFTDTDLRSESALLPVPEWLTLLNDCGFGDADAIRLGSDPHENPDGCEFSILLGVRNARECPISAALPRAADGTHAVVVSACEDPLGAELAAVLDAQGVSADHRDSRATEHTDTWAAVLPTDAPVLHVVLILGNESAEPMESVVRQAMVLRALAAACEPLPGEVNIWLVTRPSGALPAPEPPHHPDDAAAWGVARVLGNEQPGLTVRRISLARNEYSDARRLARELVEPAAEDEIVFTPAGRFVPRQHAGRPKTRPGTGRLELRDRGPSYRLDWTATSPIEPGPDEVIVATRAVGLNSRTVADAAGSLSEDAGGGAGAATRAVDCAGVVTAVGTRVGSLRVGDRVFGLCTDTIGSQLRVEAGLLSLIPPDLTFADAAALPLAGTTVLYGLGHRARLREGETLLVHGAAGGVGLMAVQYARRAGATVIATAGNAEKREFLALLGVEHVLDSRDLGFAHQVREITGGRGVDVVLNSLSGEAVERGLDVLGPGGRFIDLAARGTGENISLPLRLLGSNGAVATMDIDRMLRDNASELVAVFAEFAARLADGDLPPLPYRRFPSGRIAEAFRLLEESLHLGRVVVTFDEPLPTRVEPPRPTLDPDGCYLIVGGTSGVGALTAQWLARQGARHLVLVSTRGDRSPEADTVIAALAGLGATVTTHAADVSDEEAMGEVFADIDRRGHPLRGVVHAAALLADAALHDQDPERFRVALDPKVQGALVLDRLTRGHPLEFFVVFSSLMGLLGNLGQANYVAGNVFLEALIRRRRAAGLPGLALAWGLIIDVGRAARDSGLQKKVIRMLPPISREEVHAALETGLGGEDEVVTVAHCQWDSLRTLLPTVSAPRLAGAYDAGDGASGKRAQRQAIAFDEKLAACAPSEVAPLVEDAVAALVSQVAQIPAQRLDRSLRLSRLGLDSLMSVELQRAIKRELRQDIPLLEVLDSGISDLADQLGARLGARPEGAGPA
ncbi:type I polyketide synthase [Nocardia sp. BMG51109]|uniref:type I polyketide synthase n=1 Tax=Nocardia sp. BMG51109 TaxID=1056816 RepID=UPI000465E3EE|nr:type I polyketide synthase [Nocardia sp. BMG51109]